MVKSLAKLTTTALALAISFVMISGCTAFTGTSQQHPNNAQAAGGYEANFYYADFDDVPIPRELTIEKGSSTLLTSSGIKVGTENFKGKVDVTSLNKAMVGYMTQDGWKLISYLRGEKSILVFEKPDRVCVLYILDSSYSTGMQVFVTPKVADGVFSN